VAGGRAVQFLATGKGPGVEHTLYRLTPVPHTDGARKLKRRTLDAAVRRMVELAEEGDRLLVSWATHDRKIVEEHVTGPDLVERLTARYRNALNTARPWLREIHPEIELPKGWGGAHKLALYARIQDIAIPAKYGPGIAASGIKAMRKALAEHGSYANVPPEARAAWKALLGHNRLDCRVCGEVVRVAAGCPGRYASSGCPRRSQSSVSPRNAKVSSRSS
jgi:hypothetical protein